jgi:hypothetical protein
MRVRNDEQTGNSAVKREKKTEGKGTKPVWIRDRSGQMFAAPKPLARDETQRLANCVAK